MNDVTWWMKDTFNSTVFSFLLFYFRGDEAWFLLPISVPNVS